MITTTWPTDRVRFPTVEFRRLFRQIRRLAAADAEMVTAYTDGAVTLRSNRRLDGYHEAADMSGMQGVKCGDFVVHGLDILRGSVGVSDSDGAMSSVCVVCAPNGDAEPRYFAWLMRAQAASGLPRALARGVREGGADFRRWDTLAELPVLCPPLQVQVAIADYLDRETARIDALIAKKQRMVALIEGKLRLAIDALLGCSVVEGAAAAHDIAWVPVRYLAKVRGGITLGKQYEGDTVSVPYLRVLNVQDGLLDLSDVAELQVPPEAVARYSLVPGDLLLLEGNGNPENLGRGTLWRGEMPTCLHQNHVHVVRPDTTRVLSEYLDLVVRTSWARHHFTGGSDVVGISTLSQDRVRSLRIPCPSLEQQRRLATEIEKKRSLAKRTSETVERQIELLREHRHALIAAAVTGEFEVPGVAA